MNKKILIKNFSALTLVQLINYILPLAVLPYLVRVIGPAKFGVLAFAQAVVFYFTLIPDLGTNLYAPREIALLKDNRTALSRFLTGLMTIKLLLLIFGLILYSLTVLLVPKFRAELMVFIFSAGYMIANSLIPVWFFQGIEKMGNITFAMFLARLISLVSIFLVVRERTDYILVPLINSGGIMIGAVFMYLIIFTQEHVRYRWSGSAEIVKILKESLPLFVSNIAISIYTGINTVVLGFITNDAVVGFYSAAEKLIKAGLGIVTQLANVFYPHISRLIAESLEKAVATMRTGFMATMILVIPAVIFTITFSDEIVCLMFGQDFIRSIVPLRILALLFFVIGLSNVFGIQIFLPLGRKKDLMQPTLAAGIVNMVLIVIFAPLMKEIGAAIAFVGAEICVTIWMLVIIKRLSLNLLSRVGFRKLTGLSAGLCVYAVVYSALDLNVYIGAGFFVIVYVLLIFVLRLIDPRTGSFVT